MSLLKMKGIEKSFYTVKVLSDVSLEIGAGETHALLGENGAGKSTLMNILGGVHERDNGTVVLDEVNIDRITPKLATELGIAFVHQELNLFNDLKVYENIFLQEEITGFMGILRKKEMINKTQELFETLGVGLNPETVVSELSTSQKQLLEIAKALRRDAKLFILDEPTTSLGPTEIDHLFTIINRLKSTGKSFIFISHKMPEIFQIADRFTVLRNGCFVKQGSISEVSPEDLARLIVGDFYMSEDVYIKRELGDNVIQLENLSGFGFKDVSLNIKKGEIFAITGLQGSGCGDVLNCLFGVEKSSSGKLQVLGKNALNNSIKQSMENNMAMIPANRKENSVIADFNLLENFYISEHVLNSKNQVINRKNEEAKFDDFVEILDIKANSCEDMINTLSGGNQQKVVLARWLNTSANIILLDNPTQGVDIGAKNEIYKLIVELSLSGKTIIVHTLEIPEIMKIADRCAIMYNSRLQIILDRTDITEENVMLYATNAIGV